MNKKHRFLELKQEESDDEEDSDDNEDSDENVDGD
jgi:hypothetical protein